MENAIKPMENVYAPNTFMASIAPMTIENVSASAQTMESAKTTNANVSLDLRGKTAPSPPNHQNAMLNAPNTGIVVKMVPASAKMGMREKSAIKRNALINAPMEYVMERRDSVFVHLDLQVLRVMRNCVLINVGAMGYVNVTFPASAKRVTIFQTAQNVIFNQFLTHRPMSQPMLRKRDL